jgi:hypothetical protein
VQKALHSLSDVVSKCLRNGGSQALRGHTKTALTLSEGAGQRALSTYTIQVKLLGKGKGKRSITCH